jgi:hypothetical protein
VINYVRTNVIGGSVLGLRPYQVYVRIETASDLRGGIGTTVTNVDTLLGEAPKLTQVNRSDIDRVTAAGHAHSELYKLTRITPRNDANTVGTLLNTIHALGSTGVKALLVLVGDGMAKYTPYSSGPPVVTPTGGGLFTVVDAWGGSPFELEFILSPRTGFRE